SRPLLAPSVETGRHPARYRDSTTDENAMFPADIEPLAKTITDRASDQGLMLATAESCTAGLLVAALTTVSGSAKAVDRGFITDSNAAKAQMLGIDPKLIDRHGAVSRPVAEAMAKGALEKSGA